MDENRDGKVTAADVLWNTLRVWQDADSDGVTDDGELKLLGELGITEFSLANQDVRRTEGGDYIHSQATVVMSGQQHATQAVYFGMARNVAIFTPPEGFIPHPDSIKLPNFSGGGGTPSLIYK